MLKAILDFTVTPDMEGGDEEVALLVRLETEVEPGGALTEEAFEGLKAQVRADYSDEDGDVWLSQERGREVVHTLESTTYGYRVEQGAETLFADLRRLFEKGDWNFNRRRKVWWAEEELYRKGSAD